METRGGAISSARCTRPSECRADVISFPPFNPPPAHSSHSHLFPPPDTYDFTFGRPNSIPKGAEIGMEGMRVGGKRKISVPPELGWQTSGGFPEPQTFGGKRKLLNHMNEFLQFEVEVIRVRPKKT